jgi:dihydrofolate reductase
LHKMNDLHKVVFSRTLTKLKWNAKLVKENAVEEVMKLKNEPGGNMVFFAGAEIVSTFMQYGLIDEYRIIVNPVVLGSGNSLFKNFFQTFELVKTETFRCGNVLLVYQLKSLQEHTI